VEEGSDKEIFKSQSVENHVRERMIIMIFVNIRRNITYYLGKIKIKLYFVERIENIHGSLLATIAEC